MIGKQSQDPATELTVSAARAAKPESRMVTVRAVAIAMALMPLNAWWIIRMEVVRYAGHPTTISLFFNVVFVLALLLLANGLIRRVRPQWAFAPGEMLTV